MYPSRQPLPVLSANRPVRGFAGSMGFLCPSFHLFRHKFHFQLIVDTPRAIDMETMFESHPTHPLTVWGRSPQKLPSDNLFYLYLPLILHYLIPLFPFCLYCYACNNAATFPGQPVGSFSILTNLLQKKALRFKMQNHSAHFVRHDARNFTRTLTNCVSCIN